MGVTSNPRVTAQLLAAIGEPGVDPFRLLIVGQTGDDGNAVDGTFYEDVQDLTNAEIESLFGTTGGLLNRILRARGIAGGLYSIWVLPLAPAAGTAATADLVVAGTATEAGTITIKAIDGNDFTITVAVANGAAAATVATAIEAAFDALNRFPAVASLATATVTLTATDLGTIPNKFVVESLNIPAGLTINTNASTDKVQFTSGATDPTTTGVFDTAGTARFHTILWPWESDFQEVQDFLEARNVINNAFLQGVAMIGFDDTEANITAKVNGGTPLNSLNLIFMGNRVASGIAAIVSPPDWRAAEFGAIEGLRLTEDASISQYVTVTSPRDTVGGPGTASLGLYNTPLALTDVTDSSVLFDETEQRNLKDDGFTIIGVNPSKTEMIMAEVVSTYKFDGVGDDDNSFKFLNFIRTGYLALELYYNTLKDEYSQFRLTEGELVGGRAITNQTQLEGRALALYRTLSGPDFTLVQAGSAAEQFFFANLTITVDISEGSVTLSGQLPIVTQFREATITFQLSFSIGG